jgi:hypothetical protein
MSGLTGDGTKPGMAYDPLSASWPVADVVAEICLRAGLPFDRINIEGLEGSVDGLPVSPADAAFSYIESLAQIYLFDASNFDGQLHFVQRGGDVIAALTLDDLIDDGKEGRKLKRKDSITVPRVLHLEYYDIDGGLSADKQTSDRSLDNRATAETKIQTSVIMRADDAARAAIIMHKISIEEQRGEWEFSLPDSYVWLTDGDIITLEGERLRIVETEIDEGQQNYVARYDRQSAYASSIQGLPVQQPIAPPSLIVGQTILHFIDSHIIRDADDRLGYYVAVGRASDNWSGALVELSNDGGQNYIDSVDVLVEATIGELVDTLPAHSVYYPDDVNTARVRLVLDDNLESATLAGMMSRANLALIGNELVNFGAAEEVEPQVWQLSDWLRGRKGSPIASHPAGTRVVMMERQFIFFIDAELFELNSTLTFRTTTFGSDQSYVQSATFTGQSQTERTPGYLRAVRSGGNLLVTWQGAGRLGGGVQVGMGAQFNGYKVTIAGTEYSTQDEFLTIAEPGPSALVRVQQINQLTGAGPAAEVTV